jgi:4-hydroxy-4-methyl-2-oxoglutarate aldolase
MRWTALLIAASIPTTLPCQGTPFSSSDAADAAERLTSRRAHMVAEIRQLSGPRMAGPAITLRIVRDDSASLMGEGLKVIRVVEGAPPGSVIVACLDGAKDYAVFGATFAILAKSRKLGGFVVDGGMRGLADLRTIGVPVFARGTVPGTAGGHYRLEGINEMVQCGGATVSPGDLIVGDEDGVAVVPEAVIAEVTAKAKAAREEKEAMLRLIAQYGSYTKAAEQYKLSLPRATSKPR